METENLARVVVEYRGAYKVKNEKGEYLAKVTGKQMFEAESREDYPAVGDWVLITDLDGENAVIRKILPRKTIIKRRHGDKNRAGEKSEVQIIATNIDVAFVVESIDRDFNLNRLERYFAIAGEGGVKPVVILNKVDLISEAELAAKVAEIKKRFKEVEVVSTTTRDEAGLRPLRESIEPGKTYCFLGSSGVGKSSLINKLLGEDIIRTESIGSLSGRGKHTTTVRELYFLANGGIVIDNPGMREVGLTDASGGVDNLFDEISALAERCKFIDCTHTQEPGCQVLAALEAGKLEAEKYQNYLNLKKETEYYEQTEREKKDKDRQFGKMIKNYYKGKIL